MVNSVKFSLNILVHQKNIVHHHRESDVRASVHNFLCIFFPTECPPSVHIERWERTLITSRTMTHLTIIITFSSHGFVVLLFTSLNRTENVSWWEHTHTLWRETNENIKSWQQTIGRSNGRKVLIVRQKTLLPIKTENQCNQCIWYFNIFRMTSWKKENRSRLWPTFGHSSAVCQSPPKTPPQSRKTNQTEKRTKWRPSASWSSGRRSQATMPPPLRRVAAHHLWVCVCVRARIGRHSKPSAQDYKQKTTNSERLTGNPFCVARFPRMGYNNTMATQPKNRNRSATSFFMCVLKKAPRCFLVANKKVEGWPDSQSSGQGEKRTHTQTHTHREEKREQNCWLHTRRAVRAWANEKVEQLNEKIYGKGKIKNRTRRKRKHSNRNGDAFCWNRKKHQSNPMRVCRHRKKTWTKSTQSVKKNPNRRMALFSKKRQKIFEILARFSKPTRREEGPTGQT